MTTIISLPIFDEYDGYKREDYRDAVQVSKLIPYLSGHRGFIAGGCFKNIFLDQDFRDVDVFFETEDDWRLAVKMYYGSRDYDFHYESERAVGFRNKNTGVVVECINVFFGTPQQILNTFDFSVAKCALIHNDKKDYTFLHHEDFYKHLLLRRLVVGPVMYNPINTFERSLKYTKYGFGLCRQSKVNILAAIQSHVGLDPNNLSSSIYNGLD